MLNRRKKNNNNFEVKFIFFAVFAHRTYNNNYCTFPERHIWRVNFRVSNGLNEISEKYIQADKRIYIYHGYN